jgi:hypothetical protein
MRRPLYALLLWLCLVASGLAEAAADGPDATRQAAEDLFELPAYRQIATHQVYEALRSLPDGQYRSALDALSQPRVVQALREVIVRSMAQTFTVGELKALRRFLATDEARSALQKADALQAALLRELLAAALADPELGRILLMPQ